MKGKGIIGTTKELEGNGKAGDESASTSNTLTAMTFNDLSAAEKNEIRLKEME